MMAAMATPGSRLSDDLYSLYLAGIAWLLLPVYGNGLAVVLPSDVAGFDRTRDVLSACAVAGSVWIGFRGGPLLLNRAAVLHELGSTRSSRQVLIPRFLRQAVAYAALAAVGVTVLLAMSDAESFGFAEAGRSSVVALLAMFAAVSQAVGWLVVFKAPDGPRLPIAVVDALVVIGLAGAVAAGADLASGVGLGVLLGASVVSLGSAILALDHVPVDHLWRRAMALEDMRSAMQSFDFQQVLVSLRRAVDHSERRGPTPNLARPWMPLALWRYLATAQHGLLPRLGQFAVAAAGAGLLVAFADPADGIVALAVAAIGFVVGIELSSPVAATAGQMVFLVHYPRGSMSVLRRQTTTAVLLGLVVGLIALGWQVALDPVVGGSVLALFVFGTLAASAQGRLGSPDLAQLATVLGPGGLGPILWARALLGPILSIALTIVVSHRWLRPSDIVAPWETFALFVVVGAFALATFPLEKRQS